MTNNITAINTVITKALEEAGIRESETYSVRILNSSSDLFEFEIETEWNVVSCYADLESTRILGIMATAKSIEEVMWDAKSVARTAIFVNSHRAA